MKIFGIVGAGTMGTDIAQLAAESGYSVILYDVDEHRMKNGYERIRDRLSRYVHEGRLGHDRMGAVLSNIKLHKNMKDFINADIVLEERINRVQTASLRMSGENQVSAVHPDQDFVELVVLVRRLRRIAHENQRLPVGGDVFFGRRLEVRAGHELQMVGQFARGCLLDNRRFVGQNDFPAGRAALRQFSGIQVRLQNQQARQ